MAAANTYVGMSKELNRGGSMGIGQLDYVEPKPMPSFLPVGGTLTQRVAQYTDGVDTFSLPESCGAWNSEVDLPNVVNLVSYVAAAGYYNAVVADGTIVDTLTAGKDTYNANHTDTWDDFIERATSNISWLWGSLTEGGCGMIRVSSTQVKFIGTYGVYSNDSGDDKIAATETGPYTYSTFANGCIAAVFYYKNNDSWSGTIDLVAPTASQVEIYDSPYDDTLVPYVPNITWYKTYGSLEDTLDNTKNNSWGTPSVYNTLIDLTSVTSPYNIPISIYAPDTVISDAGYFLDYGGPDTGNEDSPYERGGDAGADKGDGDYDTSSDKVPGTEQSQFPVDAQSCGFVTVYEPSKSELQDFASWLYGDLPTTYGTFLDTIKKLQLNPMDGIISLNMAHYAAPTAGVEPINFYGQASGFSAPIVTNLTHVVDCGSVHVHEFAGGWMSYNDLTKIKVFLPYCGMFSLSTNEVMGANLNLKYIIDVLTGACVSEIQVIRGERSMGGDSSLDAPLYRFTGNIFQQVPISAVDYSGIIQGQLGLASGIASVVSGGAAGVGSLVSGFTGAMMSHPNVERVGSCGASYGYMGSQIPFLMQEYPLYNMPNRYNNYYGAPLYDYKKLMYCDGYTEVDPGTLWADHLDFITEEEEQMLKQICDSGGIYIETSGDYYDFSPE